MQKKKIIILSLIVMTVAVLYWFIHSRSVFAKQNHAEITIETVDTLKPVLSVRNSYPQELVVLQKAYPKFIDSIGDNYLIWNDGTKFSYDDERTFSDFDSLLNFADLKDQMAMIYPKGRDFSIPHKNIDPGRVRNEAFFRKMYGAESKEVAKNLVTINWLPSTVNKSLKITRINGVDKKLTAISAELEKLPQFKKYVDNPGGAFYWRTIAGTDRLSMHSFGIAIDINVNHSNYWKWSGQQNADSIPYINKIPLEIVEIFEKHGFIWGGKWYHYDTMHFEYRPELLD